MFFLGLQKKVLIPLMYFANYSISKYVKKRFEFAFMTILKCKI